MKISLQSQNPLEWLAMQTGFIPQPVLLAHFGFMLSRIIGEAVDGGVLETMAKKPQTAGAIAQHCNLNEAAVTALLNALIGLQLVRYRQEKFSLSPDAKKWLLKDGRSSYRNQVLFDNNVCFHWMNQTGHYLRTGKGLQYHETLNPAEWQLYQNAMEATSGIISKLAAGKIKVPPNATRMLDIGGAHGLYSSALLKKYPQLSAQVLDLPEAIAANSGRQNPFPQRLVFTAGNILEDDLPNETYDLVIIANVVHHFTETDNLLVAAKVLSALKPGGRFYILEFFKKEIAAAAGDMIGALQSFFFSFSSTSGLWTAATIKSWLQQTRFTNLRAVNFAAFPGFGMVSGQKG